MTELKHINGKFYTSEFYNVMMKYNLSKQPLAEEINTENYLSQLGGKALDDDAYIRDFNRVRIEGASNRVIFLRKKYEKIQNETKVLKNRSLLLKDIQRKENNGAIILPVIKESNVLFKRNVERNIISPMVDSPNVKIQSDTLHINNPISRNKSCDFVNNIHRLITPRMKSPKVNSKNYILCVNYIKLIRTYTGLST